ncbi:50S ribosomal protein L6 [Candidatus Woesearchaeota archaeon]|nr:50S ribosomal protein L6 [Candidatus Woesearchaeota archaeon]
METTKIKIPENIQITITGPIIKIKGPKGEIEKKLLNPHIEFKIENNELVIICTNKKIKKENKMFTNTYRAHIKNMINGVIEGYIYRLKVCSGHFPMTISIEKGYLLVKNFLGEKVPRKAKIIHGVDIKIEEEIITLNGIDKEKVGQMAGRIEQSTRITGRDKRVFQDGCYIIEKAGKIT